MDLADDELPWNRPSKPSALDAANEHIESLENALRELQKKVKAATAGPGAMPPPAPPVRPTLARKRTKSFADDDDDTYEDEAPAKKKRDQAVNNDAAEASVPARPTADLTTTLRFGPHDWPVLIRDLKSDLESVINRLPNSHMIRGLGTVHRCNNKRFITMQMKSKQEAETLVAGWKYRDATWNACNLIQCTADEMMYATRRIVSWNTQGQLRLKLTLPEYRSYIEKFDVIMIQETHLTKETEDLVDWPEGYQVFASSRPARADHRSPGGGVATLVKNDIRARPRNDLTGDDILTIQLPTANLINVYMAPESSPDLERREVHPKLRFTEIVTALEAESDVPTIAEGDVNARTANRQSRGEERKSEDTVHDTRGVYVLDTLASANMSIVNGTERGGPTAGRMTSYQGVGNSVVDYCMVSTSGLPELRGLHINRDMLGWADHAPLELTVTEHLVGGLRADNDVDPHVLKGRREPPTMERQRVPIDDVLEAVLASALDDESAKKDLYGPVLHDTPEVRIWTDGSAKGNDTPRAGAGVWWGERSKKNISARVKGDQKNGRAELVALALALSTADPMRTIRIYSDSSYVVGTFGLWAARNSAMGWRGKANTDVIKNIVRLVRERPCPTHFEWVKSHDGIRGNEEADRLANEGADLALDEAIDGALLNLQPHPDVTDRHELNIPKVTVVMASAEARKCLLETEGEDDDRPLASQKLTKNQKRRRRVKDAKRAHRKKLLDAANDAEFWRLFRKYANAPAPPPLVCAEQLRPVFDIRMNAPLELDKEWDPLHRARIRALAALIDDYTIDTTPERFFSRAWGTSDMESLKADIATHKEGSAGGWDEQAYGFAMTLPNDRLQDLFNTALYSTSVPGMWLTTLLAGVLKRGKAGDVPENYRTIGLECVLLKMLTLLIDKRVREWAEARKILPPSQNGFRPGYRTNNNAYILRCAAERAAAQGKTLYVASVDLSNAFPSVDRPLLWVKLRRMGMEGPLFDLYRHIYSNMSYIVRVAGLFSEAFTSDIGVLIGDPASPIMWDLFFADFELEDHKDDVHLCGKRVAHLEHADDVLLMSTSPDGLRKHIAGLTQWAAKSFVRVNAEKTWLMHTGARYVGKPYIELNGKGVGFKTEAKYVGMTLATGNTRIYRKHYSEQAKKARKSAGMCFAVEGLTGALPVEMALKIYKARVDPHLISGADVSPDAVDSYVAELEAEQVAYLRRTLGLSDRAHLAPLFSETGIWQIRTRRADLAVRYLDYALTRPEDTFVWSALQDSIALARLGCSSWYKDLQLATAACGGTLPDGQLLNAEVTAACRDAMRRKMMQSINSQYEVSPKLHLLTAPETEERRGRAGGTALSLRPYLLVERKKHRIALTRLLVSNHSLAIEQLRHRGRYHDEVPAWARKCRLCLTEVEDEIHALFRCEARRELDESRRLCLRTLADMGGTERAIARWEAADYFSVVQVLIREKGTASALARLVHEVMQVYDSVPLIRMEE